MSTTINEDKICLPLMPYTAPDHGRCCPNRSTCLTHASEKHSLTRHGRLQRIPKLRKRRRTVSRLTVGLFCPGISIAVRVAVLKTVS